MDDIGLINGLARGDKKSFEELFNKYYSSLVLFAYKIVGDEDMARELTQDVFVNFYEKRNEIKIHTSLKSHLYQSVRNRCLNYIKRESIIKTHHENLASDLKDNQLAFNHSVEEAETEERIYKAVAGLPEKCREIFEMSRFDGLSNQEIADHLKLSKRTVETQISKALRFIREKLHDIILVGVLGLLMLSLWMKNPI